MDDNADTRHLGRIAAALGVPISFFFEPPDRDSCAIDDEMLRTIIAKFLHAFAEASGPEERRRCVGWLDIELKRLRSV